MSFLAVVTRTAIICTIDQIRTENKKVSALPHEKAKFETGTTVQLWYKTFQNDQRGQIEMKNSTRLSN